MLRYMISPIVGSGSIQDPYRVSVSDVPNVKVVQGGLLALALAAVGLMEAFWK